MERVKRIRQKQADGSYNVGVPIGADAENIDMKDGTTVESKLMSVENKLPILAEKTIDGEPNGVNVGDLADGTIWFIKED